MSQHPFIRREEFVSTSNVSVQVRTKKRKKKNERKSYFYKRNNKVFCYVRETFYENITHVTKVSTPYYGAAKAVIKHQANNYPGDELHFANKSKRDQFIADFEKAKSNGRRRLVLKSNRRCDSP